MTLTIHSLDGTTVTIPPCEWNDNHQSTLWLKRPSSSHSMVVMNLTIPGLNGMTLTTPSFGWNDPRHLMNGMNLTVLPMQGTVYMYDALPSHPVDEMILTILSG